MTHPSSNPSDASRTASFSERRAARQTAYRTHLLIATAGVLVLLFGLIQLPVYMSDGLVGWISREEPGMHLIGEMDVQDAPDEAAGESDVNPEAPPTVQPASSSPTPPADAEQGAGTTDRGADDDGAAQASRVVPISALKAAKNTPEIVGGLGDFYLRIHYPEEARRAGIQGQLVLSFVVNEAGQTQNIHVEKSLHPLCDSSAVQALRDTRFVPGQQNGQNVSVRMRLPVRFRLVGPTSDAVADKTQRDSNS